ncbi:MAG: hypothetical protein ACYTGR_08820 [Planctomycetota bacterium]|jgi:hypothetical protein
MATTPTTPPAKPKIPRRLAWEDRFNQPTYKQLREHLDATSKSSMDRIRRGLLELDGVTESLTWYGDSWKWTVEFRTKHSEEPLAVIVPAPEDLQVAVPLDRTFAEGLPVRRMKRAIRDGLELAQDPFDTRWGVWSVPTVGLIGDLHELVEAKLRDLTKAAG